MAKAKRERCGTGDYRTHGQPNEQAEIMTEPCSCGTKTECYECGQPHVTLLRCPPCGRAGRPGLGAPPYGTFHAEDDGDR